MSKQQSGRGSGLMIRNRIVIRKEGRRGAVGADLTRDCEPRICSVANYQWLWRQLESKDGSYKCHTYMSNTNTNTNTNANIIHMSNTNTNIIHICQIQYTNTHIIHIVCLHVRIKLSFCDQKCKINQNQNYGKILASQGSSPP